MALWCEIGKLDFQNNFVMDPENNLSSMMILDVWLFLSSSHTNRVIQKFNDSLRANIITHNYTYASKSGTRFWCFLRG